MHHIDLKRPSETCDPYGKARNLPPEIVTVKLAGGIAWVTGINRIACIACRLGRRHRPSAGLLIWIQTCGQRKKFQAGHGLFP